MGTKPGPPLLGTMGTGRSQRVLQELPGQSRLGLTVWCTGLRLVAFPSLPFPVGISVFFQTLGLAFISLLSSPLFLFLLSKMNGEQRANRHPETAYGRNDKGFLILFSCVFSLFKGKFDPNNPHRSINFAQKASLCLENIPRLPPAATNFYFIWEQESHLSSHFAGLTHWLGLGPDILQRLFPAQSIPISRPYIWWFVLRTIWAPVVVLFFVRGFCLRS